MITYESNTSSQNIFSNSLLTTIHKNNQFCNINELNYEKLKNPFFYFS